MGLHLGAFNQSVKGWYNTDITPHIKVAKVPLLPLVLYKMKLITHERFLEHKQGIFNDLHYLDLTRPLPFESCSIEAYQTGKFPDLDKLDNRPESLFFEAVK